MNEADGAGQPVLTDDDVGRHERDGGRRNGKPERGQRRARQLDAQHLAALERRQRVRDHNTIWGPFGRNLPEDLLGVTSQGRGMQAGSEPLHVLHGRREHSAIHDELGLRCYYAEWSRRIGRSARDPYSSDCVDWSSAHARAAVGDAE